MSGAVDSGRESGHGNIDANDPKRTLVGPCGRLAKSFLDESDLIAQAGFGVFAVLDAALDQDRRALLTARAASAASSTLRRWVYCGVSRPVGFP